MNKISTQHLLGWGLSLAEYREMFDLNDPDLTKNILDFQSGPSRFNHDVAAFPAHVVSVDELYALDVSDLQACIHQQLEKLETYLIEHQDDLCWDKFASPEALLAYRQQAMDAFLADFSDGVRTGRYSAQLTDEQHFDLAVISHAMFGENSDDMDYHLELINQLIQVADEVRIFPLLDKHGEISDLVGPVSLALQQQNFGIEIREVQYHLQANANAMLRIWPLECVIT